MFVDKFATESPYDLPIYSRMYRTNKHDSVLFISIFHKLMHWYPDWKFGEAILDSAFDAYPIYKMLEYYDMSAIVDLNPKRTKQFKYNEMDMQLHVLTLNMGEFSIHRLGIIPVFSHE